MTKQVSDQFHRITVSKAAAVIPDADTEVLTIDCKFISRVHLHLLAAVAALTAFKVKAKATVDATADTLFSTAGDFATPVGSLVGCSGDLTTLSGAGWLIIDTTGFDSIIFVARSAGSATLALEAGGAT